MASNRFTARWLTVLVTFILAAPLIGCDDGNEKIVRSKTPNSPKCTAEARNLPLDVRTPHELVLEPKGGGRLESICVSQATYDANQLGSEYRVAR